MIKVLVNGAAGRMGRTVTAMVNDAPDMEVAAMVDAFGKEDEGYITDLNAFDGECDVVIDFSFHTSAPALMDWCVKNNVPAVIATTGHTDEEKAVISNAAGFPSTKKRFFCCSALPLLSSRISPSISSIAVG